MDRVPLSEVPIAGSDNGEAPAKLRRPKYFGIAKGRIWVSDDFDDPLPEDFLKSFYGLAPDEEWSAHMKDIP